MDRPLVLAGRPGGARSLRGSGRARPHVPSSQLGAAAAVLGLVSALLARRSLRIALVAVAGAAILIGGGFELLRSSSLSAVRQVQVAGVEGPEATAIDSALTEAARRMSTLAVSDAALVAAVQRFKIVRAVRAEASFPHHLRIVVSEQPPVAVLTSGSERTAVAADGAVLGAALASGSLPTLAAPAGDILAADVTQPSLLAALTVLGAAPEPLRGRVASVSEGAQGLTVTMRNGLLVYFGDATLAHAKWLALARVLADASSHGASYIDVLAPSRPAAGGFAAGAGPSVSPTAASGSGSQQTTPAPAQPTVAALAESLTAAVGGPAAAGAPSTTPQEQSEQRSGGSSAPPAGATGEGGSSGTAAEAGAGSGGASAGTTARPAEPRAGGEAPASAATGGSEPHAAEGG
jgi:cell division protein FtsQ